VTEQQRRKLTLYLFVILPVIAGLGYFLVMEHWAHLVQVLPYLILLLCPLLHVFMHGGHGHGSHETGSAHPQKHSADNNGQ